MTKRRVRAIAHAPGTPDSLIRKTPTADLESLGPGISDEEVFGFTYDNIDDFLEGHAVEKVISRAILDHDRATATNARCRYPPRGLLATAPVAFAG